MPFTSDARYPAARHYTLRWQLPRLPAGLPAFLGPMPASFSAAGGEHQLHTGWTWRVYATTACWKDSGKGGRTAFDSVLDPPHCTHLGQARQAFHSFCPACLPYTPARTTSPRPYLTTIALPPTTTASLFRRSEHRTPYCRARRRQLARLGAS